jgi:predicted MFS family arabinose efflux permease
VTGGDAVLDEGESTVVATAQPKAPPEPLWSWRLFAVICAQMACNYAISTFLLLPEYLSTQLGASASDLGHVNAIQGLVAALSVPFVGGWLERVGRRPLMAAGAAVMTVYSLCWLAVDRIGPAVFALQVLLGMANMLAFSGSITLVTDLAPASRLGQAIGVYGAGNISMNALAPTVAEALAARWGWHSTFTLAAAFAMLSLLLTRRVQEPSRVRDTAAVGGDLVQTFRVARSVRSQLLTMVSCGAAFGAVFTYYQPYVLEQGAKNVSMFFVGFTTATLFTRLGLGSLADRYGRRVIARRAFVAYALVVLSMTQLSPSSLLWFGLAFGFAHGFFYPAISALTLEVVDIRLRGRAMTLVTGAFNLGNMLSIVSLGWVAHTYGYPVVFMLASLVVAFGVAFLYAEAPHVAAADALPGAAE